MVISPAKSLDFTAPEQVLPLTTPELKGRIAELAKVTHKLTVADLRRLMHISDNLAKLNRERFQAFDPEVEEGLQALIAFNGDVYAGLAARELDRPALDWAQNHLRNAEDPMKQAICSARERQKGGKNGAKNSSKIPGKGSPPRQSR